MFDIAIVALYLLLTLCLGLYVARTVKTPEIYRTGGRQYSSWIVFATLSASFIGGGFTIGLSEKTFLYGVAFIIAIWGFSLKEILIAALIVPRLKPFHQAETVGDIMAIAFGQKAKLITGIASVLVCGGIIGAQVAACGNIIYTFLGISRAIGCILTAGIVVLYATVGGMRSVVAVDVLHFSILIIMLPLVLIFGLTEVGGFPVLLQGLPSPHLTPLGTIGLEAVIILFISFFLGETLIPPYIQRLLIGKNMDETKWGTLWSGMISVPFFLVIGLIGMLAFLLDPSLPSHLALPYTIKMVMPIGLKGLAIAAMLAVVMSSADSFLNSTATAMVKDILIPLGWKPKNEKTELITSRGVTFIIGTVAIVFALSSASVMDILLYSYQFWTPFILMPLLAAVFGVRSSDKIFVIAASVGVLTVIWWNVTHPQVLIDGALEGVIAGVVSNSLCFIICQKFFYKPKVIIAPVLDPD